MIRKTFIAGAATAAIAFAGAAIAAPPSGSGAPRGGPSQTGISARANSQGSVNASPSGVMHSSPNSSIQTNTTTTTTTKTNATKSQGLQHASPTGIANASSNSVLARSAVPSSALPGLTTGLTVQNSGGTTLGTVSQVVTGADGSIRLVVVTDTATGQTYRLAPNTLTISGGVVTTTSM